MQVSPIQAGRQQRLITRREKGDAALAPRSGGSKPMTCPFTWRRVKSPGTSSACRSGARWWDKRYRLWEHEDLLTDESTGTKRVS